MARTITLNVSNPDATGLGKINISGTNDEGVAADFYLRVVDGTGTDLIAEVLFDANVPDTNAYSDSTHDIPVDAGSGRYLQGTFTYYIIAKVVSSGTVLNTYSVTFGFTPYSDSKPQAVTLSKSTDCTTGFFEIRDLTTLAEDIVNVATREWTITRPPIAGLLTQVTTSTDEYVQIAFSHVNVAYTVTFKLNITYTLASGGDIGVGSLHQFTDEFSYFVKCTTLADICTCLFDKLNSLSAAICRVGGVDKMNADDRNTWYRLNEYLNGYQLAESCQDEDKKATYFDKLVDLLECECEIDTTVTPFVLPNGQLQVQTAWALVLTAFQNSFTNGTPALRWRVDQDNNLHIVGKLQAPNGLSIGTPYVITTGFVNVDVTNVLALTFPAIQADGNSLGALRFDTSGDLELTPGANYTGVEFFYVEIITPLNAT